MSGIRFLNIHRNWEDMLSMALGVVIGLSPWLAGEIGNQAVNLNTMLIGVLVLGLAALELVALQRWEEAGEILCGLWLIASPFAFGYADGGALRFWHFVLGAVVTLLAVLELWQDWKLNKKQLAEHGQ